MTGYECCFSSIAEYAANQKESGLNDFTLRAMIEERCKFLLTQNSYRKRLSSDKTTDAEREKLRSLITTKES